MAKKIDIAGTLNAATTDGVLGFSEQIKDESKGKMQSSLNKEFGEGIERIERKSDIAYNAVKTLEGLSNANEAMQTLAGQVVQIEENKQNIASNKADADAKLTELGSELSVSNGRVKWDDGQCYIFNGDDTPLSKMRLSEYCSIVVPVKKGDSYSITTFGSGIAYPYYVVDESLVPIYYSNVLEKESKSKIVIDSDVERYLIVNVKKVGIESASVEYITREDRNRDDKIEEINDSVTISSNEIFIVNESLKTYKPISVSYKDNTITFSEFPVFRANENKYFTIFAKEATKFVIENVPKYCLVCVKRSDIDSLVSSPATGYEYIPYYLINFAGNFNHKKYAVIGLVNNNVLMPNYAIGSLSYLTHIESYIDSFITDDAPTVDMHVTKNGQKLNISFSKNPRIMSENGDSAYLFPKETEEYTLPELPAYGIFYIDKGALSKESWVNTMYLPENSIKSSNFLNKLDLSNKVILCINQIGTLMDIGAIGHKYNKDLLTNSASKLSSLENDVNKLNVKVENLVPPKSVRDFFPSQPSYFNLLKNKCPKFHELMLNKSKDVCVCLTGTSLSQGNLYTSVRPDAAERPPLMHGYDLASLLYDKLSLLWGGQQYRRYDHESLQYSLDSSWSVINKLNIDGEEIWDDAASDKNGMTKTTVSPNASVTTEVPSNAWQFNFIYRTDSTGGDCSVTIEQGNGLMEVYDNGTWKEANGHIFTMLESPTTATKGNTIYQKRLKMRCKNKETNGINSIGMVKNITISKGNSNSRFNVVGFEWSPREYMMTFINAARGSHQWGAGGSLDLQLYQDGDIWDFRPDLIISEVTVINWGAYTESALNIDPLYYVNIAKKAYFNEFKNNPNSLYEKSNHYQDCEIIFYGDLVGTTSPSAWDSETHLPKWGVVNSAATNGDVVNPINIGRVKTNFENYDAVDNYMLSKEDFIFIPTSNVFKKVAEKCFGTYWAGMQKSGADGETLSYDGIHLNDNGAALWAHIIEPLFDF